ncbi:MAG: hypothetical protein Q8O42_14765 [Acidobacteriota bacterium]|nr:hypothetical protein [Acidobacteriota bacterium]
MIKSTTDSRLASWGTVITDALGAFAAVWGVAVGVLVIGLPIALAFALALRLGRMVFPGL